jgi:hypothetical protein
MHKTLPAIVGSDTAFRRAARIWPDLTSPQGAQSRPFADCRFGQAEVSGVTGSATVAARSLPAQERKRVDRVSRIDLVGARTALGHKKHRRDI